MFGPFPACAKDGCPWPAVCRIDQEDENGPVWVYVCPFCALEAPKILEELKIIREERRRLIESHPEIRDE